MGRPAGRGRSGSGGDREGRTTGVNYLAIGRRYAVYTFSPNQRDREKGVFCLTAPPARAPAWFPASRMALAGLHQVRIMIEFAAALHATSWDTPTFFQTGSRTLPRSNSAALMGIFRNGQVENFGAQSQACTFKKKKIISAELIEFMVNFDETNFQFVLFLILILFFLWGRGWGDVVGSCYFNCSSVVDTCNGGC